MPKFSWFDFVQDLKAITGLPVTFDDARAVRRDIARHHTLQERFCNGFQSYDGREDTAALKRAEGRVAGVERRLAKFFGDALVEFTGDPRGGTVKLRKWAAGNRRFDAYARRLVYFDNDWGGHLVYTGGK